MAIEVEACGDLYEAQERLSERKFDGIFADFEHADALQLLRNVKKSKHNKRSIAFAIVEPQAGLGEAFQAGAHFVIYKPVSVQGSKRTIRAAHGLLMREKRSHFRNDISVPGALLVPGQPLSPVLLLDLHRNGALIESRIGLRIGQTFRLWFTVPETTSEVEVEATVRWRDIAGRTGVKFSNISRESHRSLDDWSRRVSVEFDLDEALGANPGITTEFERIRSVHLR
jgi:CheY-like chemotaxis protein